MAIKTIELAKRDGEDLESTKDLLALVRKQLAKSASNPELSD